MCHDFSHMFQHDIEEKWWGGYQCIISDSGKMLLDSHQQMWCQLCWYFCGLFKIGWKNFEGFSSSSVFSVSLILWIDVVFCQMLFSVDLIMWFFFPLQFTEGGLQYHTQLWLHVTRTIYKYSQIQNVELTWKLLDFPGNLFVWLWNEPCR